MSSTILGGDFTVYFKAENNQKRIEYSGAGTTYTVRQLYSALQDLFDDLNQMDDEIPMTAQTPTEFTLVNSWFIDDTSTEYLYGGAITTSGYASNEVVKVTYTDTTGFSASDIGKTVTTTSYSGTILDYNDTGTSNYLWIRPDDPTTDLFDLGEAMAVTGGTATPGSIVVSTNITGEQLWANIYSIGSLANGGVDTTLYVVQNAGVISSAKATTDWWGFGHIDILVKVRDMGTEIDDAVVKVFGRRPTSLYDHFEVDLTAGGRNPIPLATATDLNEASGTRQMVLTTASGDFTVGEIIEDDTDSTIQGVVTSNTGTAPNITLQYYLIGDPQNDFTGATGGFTGAESSATATAVAPTNVNGATYTDITITHANTSGDLINGNGTRPYSITIDCAGRPLSEVYEYVKFITRRGSTTQLDGIDGEQYIGSQVQIEYNTQSGAFSEGAIVEGVTSGAVGTIVADHDDGATGDMILRAVRGTFQAAETVREAGSPSNQATIGSVRTINPTKQSPFGTFAGGTMFAAPGVWLTNYATGQSFQLIDDDGVVQNPPTRVTIAVTNTRLGDRVSVFRELPAGTLDKDDYAATVQTAGATSLIAGTTLSTEHPASGAVRLVDADGGATPEYRLRYTSFTGTTFTLFNLTGLTADVATSSTNLQDTGANFVTNGVKVGDLIRNTTEGVIAYVVAVVDEDNLTTTPVTDWSGDSYEIGTLPITTTVSDNIYVPFIDAYETVGTDGTPGSESVEIIYAADVDVKVRVRQAGSILPFETSGTVGTGGLSVAAIRTADSIYQ